MGEGLEVVLFEATIKDMMSKNLDGMKKKLSDFKKVIKDAEKQLKDIDKAAKDFGKGFDIKSIPKSISQAPEYAGRKVGDITAMNISAIPVVGALFGALFGSMSKSGEQFINGIALQKEVSTLSANFKNAFRKQGEAAVKSSDFFQARDIKGAAVGMAGIGIRPEQISKSQDILEKFTQSQGFTNFAEGIQALMSGNIKFGRGIEEPQLRMLQGLVPALNQGGIAAELAFKQMTQVLQNSSDSMSDFADTTKKTTEFSVKNANAIDQMTRAQVLKGTEDAKAKMEELSKSLAVKNVAMDVNSAVAHFTNSTINIVAGAHPEERAAAEAQMRDQMSKAGIKKKATGGRINENEWTLVGEKGPELLSPKNSGRTVIPNEKSFGGKKTEVNQNITLNITVPFATMATTLETEVYNILEKLSRQIFAHEAGFEVVG